jgi:hypothetical protein
LIKAKVGVKKESQKKEDAVEESKEDVDLEAGEPVLSEDVKVVGPSLMERLKAGVAIKVQDLMAKVPSRPTVAGLRQKLPAMPEMPTIAHYLPDLPAMPKIPLPQPIDHLWSSLTRLDSDRVSPIIQRVNYFLLFLSFSAILIP